MDVYGNSPVGFRTDHEITSDGLATYDDVATLHDVDDDDGYGGSGVTVVVMDSGIDASHPVINDVVDRIDVAGGGTGDEVGHGTAVAGLISQLAPNADLISLRIFDGSGRTSLDTIREAYEWLHDNTDRYDLVNMSWGARQDVAQIDRWHERLVRTNGVQDVVAAGNTGGEGGSPATSPGAFGIGAVDENGALARFSSYDPDQDNPDVMGIGKNNHLARADGTSMGSPINDTWTKASGTSFAAPIVTGLCARIRSKSLPNNYVSVFEDNARPVEDGGSSTHRGSIGPRNAKDGAGIADYVGTIGDVPDDGSDEPDRPDEPSDPDPPLATSNASVWQFIGSDTIYLGTDWLDSGRYRVSLVDSETGTTMRFEPR